MAHSFTRSLDFGGSPAVGSTPATDSPSSCWYFWAKNGPLFDQIGSSNTARLIVISQDIFRKFVGCAFLCIPHVKIRI